MGQTNYSAAKAGVAAMATTWAKELARYGIRVAAVAPGFINTEMVQAMKPEARDKLTAGIPLKRTGEPDEIAQTVEFIFRNDYVSGRCFDIDGALFAGVPFQIGTNVTGRHDGVDLDTCILLSHVFPCLLPMSDQSLQRVLRVQTPCGMMPPIETDFTSINRITQPAFTG